MEQLVILTCIYVCMCCILETSYAAGEPFIKGDITGQILSFNCSTYQIPLGQTVEIVANNRSLFTMKHSNTVCRKTNSICKPNECSCAENWFLWKMPFQNQTTTPLEVQCLMRYPERIKEKYKATLAFNGSYFWDNYKSTIGIYPEITTKGSSNSNGNSDKTKNVVIAVLISVTVIGIVILGIRYRRPIMEEMAQKCK